MKRLFLIYYSICAIVFFVSCVEAIPELPSETQKGAGSFGCLLNNELVFARAYYGSDTSIGAEYKTNRDQLVISAQCQFGQHFIFLIDRPYDRKDDLLIDTIRYLQPHTKEWREATHTGYFRITRMDQTGNFANDVVSGTFSFLLNEEGKIPIYVTKGRFDLNLTIF